MLNVHNVKSQSINEQERAVLERYANSIFYLHKNSRNVIAKYEHIIALHVSSKSLSELYSVVLISSNVMWNIRNEVDKTFV